MTTEHDTINTLSELIHTAPQDVVQACVGMLHSRHGDSFASHSEVIAMLDSVSYARETLFHSGTYSTEIHSFFAGARAQRLLSPFTTGPDKALAEELRKAIFDVELMIELNQVTDGPRNQKERAEQAERHALVGRLAKIRRALHRSKEIIENLEA